MADERDSPPKVKPKIKSAPKVRQMYWCALPDDAQLPELWKLRPVIVLSMNAKLYSAVTVIPCSTAAQMEPKKTFPMRTTIDGRAAWAICDKPMTVAVSRLAPDKTHGIVRMPEEEFHEMLALVLANLPKLPALDLAVPTEAVPDKGTEPSTGR